MKKNVIKFDFFSIKDEDFYAFFLEGEVNIGWGTNKGDPMPKQIIFKQIIRNGKIGYWRANGPLDEFYESGQNF